MTIFRLTVDYEYGVGYFWSDQIGNQEQALSRFHRFANQCFGIRKSLGEIKVIEFKRVDGFPPPHNEETTNVTDILSHHGNPLIPHGDVVVWGKIKSEFDDVDYDLAPFFPQDIHGLQTALSGARHAMTTLIEGANSSR